MRTEKIIYLPPRFPKRPSRKVSIFTTGSCWNFENALSFHNIFGISALEIYFSFKYTSIKTIVKSPQIVKLTKY